MIYLVSHYYHPESNPPANRFRYLAKILMDEYGEDQVQVITGRPNHPDGKMPPGFKGRLWKKRTGPNRERLLSIWEIPAPNQGFRLKGLGFLSFSISVFVYFLFKRMRKGDLVFVTSPPDFSMYMIWLLSRIKRNFRYALDIRDLMPQNAGSMGFLDEESLIYRTLLGLSHRAYQGAEKIDGVVEGICAYIDTQIAPKQTTLIYNPMDTEFLKPLPDEEVSAFRAQHPELFGDADKVTFLFAGSHAVYIGLIALMKALDLLRQETQQFKMILIGYGEEKDNLIAYVNEHDLNDFVTFLPYQERDELVKYICAADFCYASIIDTPLYRMVIPTKLLEYLTCNKFVACALEGPFPTRLADQNLSLNAYPDDEQAIMEMLKDLIENRERYLQDVRSREFIESEFSLPCFRERMLAFFAELVPRG